MSVSWLTFAYDQALSQVKLARGQGARVKKLKRKVSWHADQLQQERAKVASIQRDLNSTTQELQNLREQVAQLQRACSLPATGVTYAMQPQTFHKNGTMPVLQQENQQHLPNIAGLQAQVSTCKHIVLPALVMSQHRRPVWAAVCLHLICV